MKLLSIQNPKSLVGSWLFTILWCAISFPVFYVFAFQARNAFGGAIGGLFTLIGVVMLYASIKATLEYLKFGEVHLALEGAPPAIGQSFNARVNLPANAAAAGRISAELACVRVTWSRGSKGGASKGEQDAWTKRYLFPARRSALGDHAALRIDIPADKPPSDLPEESAPDTMVHGAFPGAGIEVGRAYYRWELRIKADVPGIDFERTFPLRVAPGKQPVSAPTLRRVDPVMTDAALHQRLLARRAAQRRLGAATAFFAFLPFVLPFAIAGIAVGLAGCPAGWQTSNPPVCEFAGINWGRLMAGAFELMFGAVPVGIGASIVIYFAGQAWLARDETGSAPGLLRLAVPTGVVLAVAVFLSMAWHRAPRKVEPSAAAVQAVPAADKARPASTGTWQQDDMGRLKLELASVEKSGADRPAAALALYRLSLAYERQKRVSEQEQALVRSLAILEKYADIEVKAEIGAGGGLDKEIVARRLADIYWDQRNYARAFDHYERAYRYARQVETSDSSLNLRLARNSAGRMATACMLGHWDIADSAMAELKERIGRVDAAEQKRLDYWIRTGEPRLKSRQC